MSNYDPVIREFFGYLKSASEFFAAVNDYCIEKCLEHPLLCEVFESEEYIIIPGDEYVVNYWENTDDSFSIAFGDPSYPDDANHVTIPFNRVEDWQDYLDTIYEELFEGLYKIYTPRNKNYKDVTDEIVERLKLHEFTVCGIAWRHDPDKPAGTSTMNHDIAIDIVDDARIIELDLGQWAKGNNIAFERNSITIGSRIVRILIKLEK